MTKFPSPIGELHFSIVFCLYLYYIFILVSVPYRGATFLNIPWDELVHDEEQVVSVPYRGATFLNFEIRALDARDYIGFRPLSGSYISQF